VSNVCPANAVAPAGGVCRPAAFPCDTPEVCDGVGASCPADTNILDDDGDGTCDPLDVCPGVPNPGQEDADADGRGDVCDPCTNPGALPPLRPKLTMSKLVAPGGDDKLKFKGTMTIPTSPTIDPATNGIRMVVTDDDGTLAVDATVPGGPTWIVRTGARTAWIYRDKLGSAAGIVKVVMKTLASGGEIKFLVSAKKGAFDMPIGPNLKATLVVDTPNATTGQCGEATFVAPACRIFPANGRVVCK
jgi:hypothetical protein